jgi:putative glutathione S-transferase
VDYKNIWGYARELYSIPAFKNNTYLNEFAKGWGDKDKELFADWNTRIASQIDLEKVWATDHERAALSAHPDELFLRHPEDETPEDYQSEIAPSPWNRPDWADRNPSDPKNSPLDYDASVNPLKGKIDA